MRSSVGPLLLVLAACGSPPPPPSGVEPTAPMAPAPVELTPCPAGWREIAGEPATCDPWPAGGRRDDCAFDEAHFPGTEGCARVGTECAADGWPSGLPAGATVVHVDDAAPSGGDGSEAHPLSSIAAALASAPDGAIVAIASGQYDEDLVVARGITLWGACTTGTRLTSSRDSEDAPVVEMRDGAALRNLAIDHPARYGVIARGGATTLEDVVVDGAHGDDLWTESGTATLHRVVLRGALPVTSGGLGGGAEAGRGTAPRIVLDQVVVDGCTDIGLFADSDAVIEGHDVVVAGMRGAADGTYGIGAAVSARGRLALERVVMLANVGDGIGAEGGTVELSDVVIADDTELPSDAVGVRADSGAMVTLTRARIQHMGMGLAGTGAGTIVDATDVVLTDLDGSENTGGRGGVGQHGASLTLTRARIARVASDGVVVGAAGTTLVAVDVTVQDVRSRSTDGELGSGIAVEDAARATLERVRVERARDAAILAIVGGRIDGRDVRITDTLPSEAGTFGIGLIAQEDATIEMQRLAVERSRVVGIGSVVRSRVVLTDTSVEGTTPGCYDPGCPGDVGGYGLAAYRGAVLDATRFRVSSSAVCGVIVGDDDPPSVTAVDLVVGTVVGAAIGACVQVPGYDTERLHGDVRYVEVGIPLQATSYTLPRMVSMPSAP